MSLYIRTDHHTSQLSTHTERTTMVSGAGKTVVKAGLAGIGSTWTP